MHKLVLLVFSSKIICFLSSELIDTFAPVCELHDKSSSKVGHISPNKMLPSKANENWLPAPAADIQRWYDHGKQECQKYLTRNFKFMRHSIPQPFDYQYSSTSSKCRGSQMLFHVAGLLAWSFGPILNTSCPTYSKCWFGVLTCGTFKKSFLMEHGPGYLQQNIFNKYHINESYSIPSLFNWSIRSLYIHMRVIGHEIVVPEQRYYSLLDSSGTSDDVLIAQFVLTVPDIPMKSSQVTDETIKETTPYHRIQTKLELRQFELYQNSLYNWSDYLRDEVGIEIARSIYLGGSELRCRPWVKCVLPNFCCGCDEKSFVSNSPISINVTDGRLRCPEAREKKLPLCQERVSTEPGRWVLSKSPVYTPNCQNKTNEMSLLNILTSPLPLNNSETIEKNYTTSTEEWFEASGDPCLVREVSPEDNRFKDWFFAPYRCKYHFYTRPELHKCLKDLNITHIHFQGDSMSRNLFGATASYLGIRPLHLDELKAMTNIQKLKRIKFHSGDVLITDGNAWDWDPEVMNLAHHHPQPQVIVTNYALAHRFKESLVYFHRQFNKTEYNYWKNQYPLYAKPPKYLFYQSGKDLHGRPGARVATEYLRRSSEIIRRALVDELGFAELDEFVFTAGRIDTYGEIYVSDGWHFYGTIAQMEVVILFNMICNDWYSGYKI